MSRDAIKSILNKMGDNKAITDAEDADLRAWVGTYPMSAPIIDKMVKGQGAGALSGDEKQLIQSLLNATGNVEERERPRKELEAAAQRSVGIGTKLKDLAASFGEGAAGVPQFIQRSVGTLADVGMRSLLDQQPNIAMEGMDTDPTPKQKLSDQVLAKDFEQQVENAIPLKDWAKADEVRNFYQEAKSPELRARQALSQERMQNANADAGGGVRGAVAEGWSRLKDMTDPAILANTVVGQLPVTAVTMATGGPAARLGLKAGLAAETASALGSGTGVALGAIGQGADVAGDVRDDMLAQSEEAWRGNKEYMDRIARGENSLDVKTDIANRQARQAFITSGAASLAINTIPGMNLTEGAVARAATGELMNQVEKKAVSTGIMGTVGRGALHALKEGVGEAAEEGSGQFEKNRAEGKSDLFQGVGQSVVDAGLGSILGPSLPIGQVEAFHERHKALHEEPNSSLVAPSSPSSTTGKASEATTQSGTDAAASAESGTGATGTNPTEAAAGGEKVAPVASTDGKSMLDSHLEAKKKDLDIQFEDLLASESAKKNPGMAEEAKSWRLKNPLGDADAFERHFEQVKLGAISALAAQDPKVQEAQQSAQQAQVKVDQVQEAIKNPLAAPPEGVTVKEMQDAAQDGGAKLQAEAHAQAENVRTVQQTVEAEIKDATKTEPEEVTATRIEEGKRELAAYKEAVMAGAISLDEAKFKEIAAKAGTTEVESALKLSSLRENLRKKNEGTAGAKAETQGFTPAPGENGSNLSGLTQNPQPSPSGAPDQAILGHESSVRTAAGKTYKVRLAVVPMESLKTSDMEGYPSEVQPRDRTRYTNNDMVRKIGNDLDPLLLLDSRDATTGAPIIGKDGVVEGGNGRVMGMRLAQGKPGWGKYQSEILSRAESYGIDPEAIKGIKDPVLVRVRESEVRDRGAFARELNESMVTTMDLSSQAKADARGITPEMIEKLPEGVADLTSKDAQDFMTDFVNKVVPASERGAMFTKSNDFSLTAIFRAKLAIFSKAFGSADPAQFEKFLSRMAEEQNPEGLNIVNALRESSPLFMQLEEKIAKGEREKSFSIAKEVISGAIELGNLRNNGMSLADFLSQESMLDEVDPMAKKVLAMMDASSRSAGKIQAVLKEYARLALAAGEAGDGGLFGEVTERPTRDAMWAAANKGVKGAEQHAKPKPTSKSANPGKVGDAGGKASSTDRGGPGAKSGPAGQSGTNRPAHELNADFGAKNTVATRADLEAALANIRAKSNRLNAGIDPEYLRDGIIIAAFYMEGGIRKFADVAKEIAKATGKTLQELRPDLRSWYNGARDKLEDSGVSIEGMDSPEEVARQMQVIFNAAPVPTKNGEGTPLMKALDAFSDFPKDNRELRSMLKQIDGRDPEPARMKEGQEALEAIMVLHGRDTVDSMRKAGFNSDTIFDQLVQSYNEQPNLNIRSTTSMENQAYSTPLPLGFAAGLMADTEFGTVYEPTVGHGSLLIGADPARVWANELDPGRYERVKSMGFAHLREGDAMEAVATQFAKPKSVDAVVTNPPFGAIKEDGNRASVDFGGYKLSKIDHLIAAESLRAMKDDGRAVLILGGTKFGQEVGKSDKIFLNWLKQNYNVISHFQMDGDLYSRQGASWPVRILVVNGRGKTESHAAANEQPMAKTWEEVKAYVNDVLGSSDFAKRSSDRTDNGPGKRKIQDGGRDGNDRSPSRKPDSQEPENGDGSGTGSQGDTGSGSGSSGLGDAHGNEPGSGTGGESAVPTGAQGDEPGGDTGNEPVVVDGSARSTFDAVVDPDALTQPYTPRAYQTEIDKGVFVPTNLLDAMNMGLDYLTSKVGDLKTFLSKELGYSPEKIEQHLAGIQTESVAGAVHNLKEGKGTIIADDTGIGKGRQAYMVMRWAIKNGKIPVLLTEKTTLFSASAQDAYDCEDEGLVKPYIFNAGTVGEYVSRDENGTETVSVAYKAENTKDRKKTFKTILETGSLPNGYNAIFATYTQFGQANTQREVLKRLGPNAILIMDEAHEASGEDSNRGEYFRNLSNLVSGAVYLSATWAKRPGNMTLYKKSAIGDMNMSTEELESAVMRGGLPLQTMIASSMAKFAQFFRRERSFEGVDYQTRVYGREGDQGHEIDSKGTTTAQHAETHDRVTSAFRQILDADDIFGKYFEEELMPQLIEQGATGGNTTSQSALVTRAEFASTVHNGIRTLALALKADWVADMAIAALKRGEAPVISLEMTMGSFLSDYAAKNGIKPGDPIPNFGWNQLLHRYLDRILNYNYTDERGNDSQRVVPLSWLPEHVLQAIEQARDAIDAVNVDIPVSPIDYIRNRMKEAGYSIEEITGESRSLRVDYSTKVPTLIRVSGKEDHEAFRRDFNANKLDAIIFNVAGATGISLHTDKRWVVPGQPVRRRHMIVAQAMLDINKFKQALGRVHRTNQVIPPRYSILALDLPSELRPVSMLQKKFKSLNASTSSNIKGNMDVEGEDILNRYGDEIVAGYLFENPDVAEMLGINIADSADKLMHVDLAKRATGKLAILPVVKQKQFYDAVIPAYRAHIEYLTKTGQNEDVVRMRDIQGEENSRKAIYPGSGIPGPFSDPAHLVVFKGRDLSAKIGPEQINSEIKENLKGKGPAEHRFDLLESKSKEWDDFTASIETGPAMEKAKNAKAVTEGGLPQIGSTWRIKLRGDEMAAVVTRLGYENGKGNPYAPSKWIVEIATNGGAGKFSLPLTSFLKNSEADIGLGIEEMFKEGSATRTYSIVMGNIFGAFQQLKKDGEIITFTNSSGQVQTGMLMGKTFDAAKDVKTDVKITGGERITQVMEKLDGSVDPFLFPDTKGATISVADGKAHIELESKSRESNLRWAALTGLEFIDGTAVVEIGPKTTEAFKNISVNVDRDVLNDIGIMKDGVVDIEALKNPTEILEISPEHVRISAKYLCDNGILQYSDIARYESMAHRVRNEQTAFRTETFKLNQIAERLRNRERVDFKTIKSFVSEVFGRNARKIEQKRAPIAQGTARNAQSTLSSIKSISQVMARAHGLKMIENRRVPTGIINWSAEYSFGKEIRRMFPFIQEGNSAEAAAYLEYLLHHYNEKHPDAPLPSLKDQKHVDELKGYLESQRQAATVNMNKWTAMASVGIGMAASGAVVPGLFQYYMAGVATVLAWKAARKFGSYLHRLSPAGKILAAASNGSGPLVVEMLDRIYNKAQQIRSGFDIQLEKVKNRVQYEAIRSVFPDAGGIRSYVEMKLHTSKEVQAKIAEYARAISDYLEGKAELPTELDGIGDAVKALRADAAGKIEAVGGKTIEDHFHRVYDFAGLQALKADPKAFKRLVMEMAPQVQENEADRVQSFAQEHGIPVEKAAFMVTMNIMSEMYDGSEAAEKGAARLRSDKQDAMISSILKDMGEGDRKVYDILRSRMKNQVSPYTASGMKKRKLSFQMPETWSLSSGEEVQLVNRDYFSVQAKYNETMARSLAQKELLHKGMTNRFINSIADEGDRDEVRTAIRNELWNRYLDEAPISEGTRAAIKYHKMFNSVVLLGLSPMFAMRNLFFAPPKAAAFVGFNNFLKGGTMLWHANPFSRNDPRYERARVAGAVMDGVVEATIGNDKRLARAAMSMARRSQQAVDIAGFYAGVFYGKECVEKAKGGDAEASETMRKVFGQEHADAIMSRDDGSMDESEENQFGLYFRNLISGTGRGFNLPSFMSNEVVQWLLQMKRIPMEDTILWADRIAGRPAEARYWSGAALAGGCVLTVMAMLKAVQSALGNEPDDEDKSLMADAYDALKKSSAMNLFEPIFDIGMYASGVTKGSFGNLAFQASGASLPISQAVGVAAMSHNLAGQINEEDGPTGMAADVGRNLLSYLLLQIPITKQLGYKEPLTEFGKGQ